MSFEPAPAPPSHEATTAALVLHDPQVMRALAHPRRMELLRHLRADGPATATMLGEATRQSPASASYHLRQLAAHGLVEELTDRGVGRERWWRARHGGTRIESDALDNPDTRTASVAVAAAALQDARSIALAFLDAVESHQVDDAWTDAACLDDTTIHVTLDELRDIGERLAAVIAPYVRADKASRPPDARRCHVSLRALPVVQP